MTKFIPKYKTEYTSLVKEYTLDQPKNVGEFYSTSTVPEYSIQSQVVSIHSRNLNNKVEVTYEQ